VKRGHDAGHRAQIRLIAQQLAQGVPGTGEEEIHHPPRVALPKPVQFARQGEDHVVVVAVEQPRSLLFQPPIDLKMGTPEVSKGGTGPVLTGVVPHPLHIPLGAGLHMPAQGGGAALHDRLGRFMNMKR
jgi:hypothetical protein